MSRKRKFKSNEGYVKQLTSDIYQIGEQDVEVFETYVPFVCHQCKTPIKSGEKFTRWDDLNQNLPGLKHNCCLRCKPVKPLQFTH